MKDRIDQIENLLNGSANNEYSPEEWNHILAVEIDKLYEKPIEATLVVKPFYPEEFNQPKTDIDDTLIPGGNCNYQAQSKPIVGLVLPKPGSEEWFNEEISEPIEGIEEIADALLPLGDIVLSRSPKVMGYFIPEHKWSKLLAFIEQQIKEAVDKTIKEDADRCAGYLKLAKEECEQEKQKVRREILTVASFTVAIKGNRVEIDKLDWIRLIETLKGVDDVK